MSKFTSRRWRSLAFAAVAVIVAGAPAPVFALSVGNRVQATATVNVRNVAAGSQLGQQTSGAKGTIIAGPQTATLNGTSYTWWNINWDSGVDGWVADIGLAAVASAPGVPQNPSPGSLSSPGPTQSSNVVTLSWNGAAGATYYGLGVRDIASDQLVVDTNTTSSSFAASLTAGRKYRWNVAACNSAGCSGYTTVLYFQTPGGVVAPATPSNPSPGSLSAPGPVQASSTVALSWSGVTGATYYGLGVRDLITDTLVVDTNVSSNGFTATLSPGRPYRWNVAACNSAGCSQYTSPLYLQTPAAIQVPPTPGSPAPGTAASPGPTLSSAVVALSWGSVGSATFYGLGVRDMTSGILVVDTNTTGSSLTVTLVAGRQYRWNVSACNAGGCSVFTTGLYFQTSAGVPPTPASPLPGVGTPPGPVQPGTVISFDWDASPGATSYSVDIRDVVDASQVFATTTSIRSVSVELPAGRSYRWVVKSCNAAGCSSETQPRYFMTPAAVLTAPVPIGPGAATGPGPVLTSNSVTLNWQSPTVTTFTKAGPQVASTATKWIVSVWDSAENQLAVSVQRLEVGYTTLLKAARKYFWSVVSCNNSGCSPPSSPRHFQTPPVPPPPATKPFTLSFPLNGTDGTPASPFQHPVVSIFDHSMSEPYSKLVNEATMFTGEKGDRLQACPGGPGLQCAYFKPQGTPPGQEAFGVGVINYTGAREDGDLASKIINYRGHPGYDLRAAEKTMVFAAAAGKVVCANRDNVDDSGIYVQIQHGDTGYLSQYLHLFSIKDGLKYGDDVAQDELIGLSGGTSGATPVGPHLHFEVKKRVAGTGLTANCAGGKPNWKSVDPYGWSGPGADPYELKSGVKSERSLWGPLVHSIRPSAGPTKGGTPVVISGNGIQAGATVSFGGSASTSVSLGRLAADQAGESLTVSAPAHNAGAVTVIVTNPDGTQVSIANGFTYVASAAFTDDPLTPGSPIKAVHILELRNRIDAVRSAYGLPAYPYADELLVAATTPLRAQHILDLRAAVTEACAAAGIAPPVFTDPSLGGVTIKALHISELRVALLRVE